LGVEPDKAIECCREAKRILIIKTNLLGDCLNFIPVANFLRKFASSAKISWLVTRPGYAVVSELGDVDDIILLEDKFLYNYKNLWKTASWLREQKFDLLVTSYQEECFLIGLLALLSRAPKRAGYNERNRGWFFNIVALKGDAERRVEINGQIIKALGGGDVRDYVYVPRANAQGRAEFAERLEREFGLRPKNPLCVLHLFSSKPTKSWRIEHADELIIRLKQELGLTSALVGSEPEVRKWGEEKKSLGLINLAGQISVIELYYLIEQAGLFIGIDSFPLQLTEFAVVNSIALFGSTKVSENQVPSAKVVRAEVDCAPCWPEKEECDQGYKCWMELRPDLILKAAKELAS